MAIKNCDLAYLIVIHIGRLLHRRILAAINEVAEKKWAYEQFSSALGSLEVKSWTKEVEDWEGGKSAVNPYEIRSTGMLDLIRYHRHILKVIYSSHSSLCPEMSCRRRGRPSAA